SFRQDHGAGIMPHCPLAPLATASATTEWSLAQELHPTRARCRAAGVVGGPRGASEAVADEGVRTKAVTERTQDIGAVIRARVASGEASDATPERVWPGIEQNEVNEIILYAREVRREARQDCDRSRQVRERAARALVLRNN